MSKEIDPAANPAGAAKAVAEAPSQADVEAFASKISDMLGKQMGDMFTEYKAQLAEHAKAATEGKPENASEVDAENIFKAKTANEWLKQMGSVGVEEDKPTFSKALAHAVVRGLRDGNGNMAKGFDLARKEGELKGFEVMCAKALGADDASAGGFLVQPQMAAEVIPALLSETGVFGDPGIRRVPVNGQLEINYESTAPTERWVAENAAANATEPVLDQLTLRPERVSIVVPTSKKLLRSTALAANWIDQSIRRRFEERVDNQFIRSLGVSNTPVGLRYLAASANVLNVNATVSAANTDTDLLRLFQVIQAANVPMTALRFMISPRSWRYLNALRGTDVYLSARDVGRSYPWCADRWPIGTWYHEHPREPGCHGHQRNRDLSVRDQRSCHGYRRRNEHGPKRRCGIQRFERHRASGSVSQSSRDCTQRRGGPC